ncbi:RNA-binding S4 domain-containing protein [Streptomyces sp. NPDC059708]|uniref:RNA-binding S4 domain-containing protein n=1 Tax=Streptomyces sp. NPDC059708 TaxID=3346916 RepID=UPI0036753776
MADTKNTGGAAGTGTGPLEAGTARVDAWIWSVRLTKTRSVAATACRAGHVKVNGERAKPAQPVRAGDEVRLFHAGRERVVVVRRPVTKRVGAPVAVECFVDNSPAVPTPVEAAVVGIRDRGAGRPTKRERREFDTLRGR